jgi:hypothetical protein
VACSRAQALLTSDERPFNNLNLFTSTNASPQRHTFPLMEAQYQNFALPQRRKMAQFNSINSAARSMPLEQSFDFSIGASDAFYSIPYYQNYMTLAAQSQWMCPPSVAQPTLNAFLEEPTQYGQAFGAAPTQAGSSYSDSTVVASPELQEYNSFLDDNYKNPIMSTMPLQGQFADPNVNACGTLSMATSSQTAVGYFLCSLISTSPDSAPVAPSYEDQDQGALSSQSPREVLVRDTGHLLHLKVLTIRTPHRLPRRTIG